LAFFSKDDLKQLYEESTSEKTVWQENYPEYERLMDNGLMEALDPNLPEVNDGSLAAALFKLPKRIVSKKLSGTVRAVDRDEAWLSELANLHWHNTIIPNAKSQAPFHRKWKDAVRKAAGYGGVPLISLPARRNGKYITDFIVAQPQDVALEAGKVSDDDSDVIFWDVYFTKLQVENMIEQAKEESKEKEGYNKWDVDALQKILDSKATEERTDQNRNSDDGKNVRPSGFKFCVAFQRGVEAPFYMYHSGTNKTVREWSNPDPTGDIPVHYLYCYQDFKNPYGVGIVKLAGGTQNVLDYMRKADVLATQIGLRPPVAIEGNEDDVDIDSIVYAQDAIWFTGGAKVVRQELSDGIYQQLPERMSMYKTSLNQLIPTGDTSIQAGAGDPNYSKTPAGVKFQAASLSIDDEDFKDNLYITYAAVAKSMINIDFANREGTDPMKVSDDEREILQKAGLKFPENEDGEMSNETEIVWDTVRAEFEFEVDPETDKAKDDADKLEGLSKVAELTAADSTLTQDLAAVGKKFNKGELYAEIIKLTSDNDKIITDVSPDEEQANVDPATGQPIAGQPIDPNQPDPMVQQQSQDMHELNMQDKQLGMAMKIEKHQQSMQPKPAAQEAQPSTKSETAPDGPSPEEMQANIQAVMQQFGVDEETATTALAAEHEGLPVEDIIAELQKRAQEVQQ